MVIDFMKWKVVRTRFSIFIFLFYKPFNRLSVRQFLTVDSEKKKKTKWTQLFYNINKHSLRFTSRRNDEMSTGLSYHIAEVFRLFQSNPYIDKWWQQVNNNIVIINKIRINHNYSVTVTIRFDILSSLFVIILLINTTQL